jgi:hypothetical protein
VLGLNVGIDEGQWEQGMIVQASHTALGVLAFAVGCVAAIDMDFC